ncbi:MAG: amino acid ABC transporter permease [Proteobacteria bacterium]|nr:amino acid ABC transporter permease [Pseudomonadota bacterium]
MMTTYRSNSLFGIAFQMAAFGLTSGFIVFVLVYNSINLGYNWQWYRVPRYLATWGEEGLAPGILLDGLGVTLKISAVSLLLSFLIGLSAALLKLSSSYTGRIVARIYVESIRNTPLLIQLFLIYFVVAPILDLSPFVSAVVALSLFEGAYASEIIRAGIMAVPKGQWESAYSLGFGGFDSYRLIVLPQAFRVVAPPLSGQAISLIKDSALVSTIAIYDLTMQGQAIVSETFLTFEIWFTVAGIYLIFTVSLSAAVRLLEKRMERTNG